jgi:hypothetical protein
MHPPYEAHQREVLRILLIRLGSMPSSAERGMLLPVSFLRIGIGQRLYRFGQQTVPPRVMRGRTCQCRIFQKLV